MATTTGLGTTGLESTTAGVGAGTYGEHQRRGGARPRRRHRGQQKLSAEAAWLTPCVLSRRGGFQRIVCGCQHTRQQTAASARLFCHYCPPRLPHVAPPSRPTSSRPRDPDYKERARAARQGLLRQVRPLLVSLGMAGCVSGLGVEKWGQGRVGVLEVAATSRPGCAPAPPHHPMPPPPPRLLLPPLSLPPQRGEAG